ncbi:MAG TPA: DMT family transporter [Anaerolineaceae bacterium]|nr:DMT family transporter [Anaerolineaceae bacterium]
MPEDATPNPKLQAARPLKGEWLLLLTALIWGSGFIAQRQGMLHFKPFTFIAIRFLIGGCMVLAFLLLRKKTAVAAAPALKANPSGNPKADPIGNTKGNPKALVLGILACGLALCGGTSLQQIGLITTTASKAGFITALYMVFVPFMSLLLGRKIPLRVWLGVLLAGLGLYFLSIRSGFRIEQGDLTVLLGSVVWACHILLIDHFSARVDSLKLACGQFFVTGLIAGLIAIFFEGFQVPAFSLDWWSVLYAGVMVVGVAFTLQVVGQQSVKPAIGALILSLEAAFALLFGVLLLGERPSPRELLGCALVAIAVLLVQLRLPAKAQEPPQR